MGVGVGGWGVALLVIVGVKLEVAVGVFVGVAGEIVADSVISVAADSSRGTGVVELSSRLTGICSQAWRRITRMRSSENLRHTLAVYHNPPYLWSRLSLSEYKSPTNPIQPFTGKIARDIYQWRSGCVSLLLF